MGEVIKHGLIRDKEYYTWLLENQAAIHERDQTACLTMIVGSNRIKREVVEIDPREQNERATLNFGHTLGHAIEKLMDFKLLHGRCVALGAAAALEICRSRGLVSAEEVADYRKAAKAFGISLHVAGLDSKAVIAATKNDKKMEKLRDAVLDDTQNMKYNRKQLKAKVKYKDYDCKYSIVLNMSTVARGRVFLNNYYIYKDVV